MSHDGSLALAINTRMVGKPTDHACHEGEWQRAILRPSELLQRVTVEGHAFTAALRKNGARHRDNFDALNLAALDFDHAGIDQVTTHPLAQHASFAYESASSTPEKPRCRLVFALDNALNYEQARQTIQALQYAFRDLNPDVSTKDPVRCWYGAPGREARWIGGILDAATRAGLVDAMPKPTIPAAATVVPAQTSSAWVTKALEEETARVRAAAEGSRNHTLFGAACKVFEIVNSGALDMQTARHKLTAAATATGLEMHEIETTIRSAEQRTQGKARTPAPLQPINGHGSTCIPKEPDWLQDAPPVWGDGMTTGDDFKELGGDTTKERRRPPSQADKLYTLATLNGRYFTARHDGMPYASVWEDGHRFCLRLGSDRFKQWLSVLYHKHHDTVIGDQPRSDCIHLLAFHARKTVEDVWTRVGYSTGKVYIDLCTPEGNAVEVDEEGWRIVGTPPVHFLRSSSMLPLPMPMHDADAATLRKYLNIHPDDWTLVASWIVAAFHPRGPYPILAFLSRAGSGKSTQLRVLKRIIDPSAAELRSQPTDVRDLFIAAANSWVVAFDNVSRLSPEISDALCTIATGGAYTKRANYTDGEEAVFSVQRPMMLNGIGDVISRQDLMDRAIVIGTPYIAEEQRRDEAEFWRDFEEDRATILGAFLNALSVGLANVPSVTLERTPRMADFARLAVAAEPAYQNGAQAFIEAYTENRDEAADTIVENSPLGSVLLRILGAASSTTETPEEWYTRISAEAKDFEKKAAGFPRHFNQLKESLERIAPALERQGVTVTFKRTKRARQITITQIPPSSD